VNKAWSQVSKVEVCCQDLTYITPGHGSLKAEIYCQDLPLLQRSGLAGTKVCCQKVTFPNPGHVPPKQRFPVKISLILSQVIAL
jgi:hypothetical protein